MASDLIERLRFELRDWDGKSRLHFPEINALTISQAADHIASLEAEVAALRTGLEQIRMSGIHRDTEWFGMTAADIASALLSRGDGNG